jgi:hypothetical protein
MSLKTRFNDNETDNYQQDHYQLHEKVSQTGMRILLFNIPKERLLSESKENAKILGLKWIYPVA